MKTSVNTGISVIMPTFNQASFVACAISSLLKQEFKKWELVIINDGSTDNTESVIRLFIPHDKIRYIKNIQNKGLGVCLNQGIKESSYNLISYLPSDDVIFPTHLESLFRIINQHPSVILAYSGIKYISNNLSSTIQTDYQATNEGYLELVQVLHRKTGEKWVERSEFVSEDYFKMYWMKLLNKGLFIPTRSITCQLTDHPDQRHKKISKELGGGLNSYRCFYQVNRPIRLKCKNEGTIDESLLYCNFKKKHLKSKDGLKIILVGELAFNPERVYALEEAGHELYGLWIKKPWWFHTVGPIPFGNIIDIPYCNWKNEISSLKPDIIYALLSTLVIPLATEVRSEFPAIPFIWHFKEGPFYCRQKGLWNELHYLQTKADGIIYINEEIRQFYNTCFPLGKDVDYMILDGDLPKINRFKTKRSILLSQKEGGFHTVVPGRPFGISPENIKSLANNNIHFHFYGENWQREYLHFIKQSQQVAPFHLHLHPYCDPDNWTEELSQYDAGWLHNFKSKNNGDVLLCTWEDLNLPARMATLVSAGLPLLQYDNSGHMVATQSISNALDIGIFYKDLNELSKLFNNRDKMNQLRDNVWKNRMKFSFDYYVPELIDFFKRVIKKKRSISDGYFRY